jgi:hypothetical protein
MLSGSTACADHGMTFLHGHELTSRMQSLVREPGPLKVAIPDGGPHALRRLGLDPTRPGTRMVCCLNGSVSASEVIGHLGEGARQNDRLRAKVIWTPSAAIVGSADALSNGIPDDEKTAAGLIEAGVLVREPETLGQIERWFDDLFDTSKEIIWGGLAAAQKPRDERPGGGPGSLRKRELVEIPITELEQSQLGV